MVCITASIPHAVDAEAHDTIVVPPVARTVMPAGLPAPDAVAAAATPNGGGARHQTSRRRMLQ
jgi:hypothetical protein